LTRNLLTLQFLENGLIILNKKKLQIFKLNSVNNYQVINKEQFIEEITKILEDNKINNNFLTDNINIIVDSTYSNLYLSTLKYIFKELSFNKIEFINIINILNPKGNEIIIDISSNSIKVFYKDTILYTNIYYSKYKQFLGTYIKNIKKTNNINSIHIYGTHTCSKKFIEDIEKICKIKTYIYTNPELIPIKLLI